MRTALLESPRAYRAASPAADGDLTGHLWHPSADQSEHHYVGRRRILFACEADAHAGILEARRMPAYPPRHPGRRGPLAGTRRVRLPGPKRTEQSRPDGAIRRHEGAAETAGRQQAFEAA